LLPILLQICNISVPILIVSSFRGSMMAGTIAVLIESLLLLLSFSVYRLNYRLRDILSRLTKKFQVAENIEASSTLLLISLVWLSLEIPSLVCLILILSFDFQPRTPPYSLLTNIYFLV
ncbi:hypothetical protein PMAYCL1PPCAC_02412, partial [Pristionchus mayeri]